ncbi:hypothetical protein ABK905_06925 [Acerihabitans sp. KWT182]|uniref:DUF4868 domain-containing protein n=1 Tax=Acerihabitans sp. KWT182 TaxID=3157919 RepID=A0AAU7QDU4_9GAMM
MNDPVMYLSQAMGSYQTRTALAEELISINCSKNGETEEPYVAYYKYYNDQVKCADVLTNANNASRLLPKLDLVFEKQNADIADAFAEVDKQIIYKTLSGIDRHEVDFLSGAEAHKVSVRFAHRTRSKTPLGYLAFSQYDNLTIEEFVDVFVAKKNNEERVFALIKQEDGYRIKRVDENVAAYYEFIKRFRSELEGDGNIRVVLQKERWGILQTANQSLKVLAASLSQIHRNNMYVYLNASGYDKTAAEKTRDFFFILDSFL